MTQTNDEIIDERLKWHDDNAINGSVDMERPSEWDRIKKGLAP